MRFNRAAHLPAAGCQEPWGGCVSGGWQFLSNAEWGGSSGTSGHVIQPCDAAGSSGGGSTASASTGSVATAAALEIQTEAVHNVDLQVQDGDMIDIDVGKKAMTLEIPEQVPTVKASLQWQREHDVLHARQRVFGICPRASMPPKLLPLLVCPASCKPCMASNLQELQSRREAWVAPPLKTTGGTLYKYCKLVASASLGCVDGTL